MPDLLLICLLKVEKHAEMLVVLSGGSENLSIRFLGLMLVHHVVIPYQEPTIYQTQRCVLEIQSRSKTKSLPLRRTCSIYVST